MSIESVLENCLTPLSDEERIHKKDLLEANIRENQKRFEKLLFTYSFEGGSMAFWEMARKKGETASDARRKYFEEHKQELAHKYLEMLCDLYDFKK